MPKEEDKKEKEEEPVNPALASIKSSIDKVAETTKDTEKEDG